MNLGKNFKFLILSAFLFSCANPESPAGGYISKGKSSNSSNAGTKNDQASSDAGSKTEVIPNQEEGTTLPNKEEPVVEQPVKMPEEMTPPEKEMEKPTTKVVKFEGKIRVMPLGASFTQGVGSKKAGYRGFMEKFLTEASISHQFVGSSNVQPGDLPKDQLQHEGHPGFVITAGTSGRSGITDGLAKWLGPQGADPQVFTILVGSNDVDINYKFDQIEERYDAMLSMILDPTKGLKPDAIVIVSTIALNSDATKEVRTQKYNAIIKKIADRRKAKGERVYSVDVHAKLDKTDMTDGLHANDKGYEKVGRLFADKIKEAITAENARK